MKNLAINILTILICLAVVATLIWGTLSGLSQQDEIDCSKWAKEAPQYAPNYYITPNQKEQCDYFGITINAPIK